MFFKSDLFGWMYPACDDCGSHMHDVTEDHTPDFKDRPLNFECQTEDCLFPQSYECTGQTIISQTLSKLEQGYKRSKR